MNQISCKKCPYCTVWALYDFIFISSWKIIASPYTVITLYFQYSNVTIYRTLYQLTSKKALKVWNCSNLVNIAQRFILHRASVVKIIQQAIVQLTENRAQHPGWKWAIKDILSWTWLVSHVNSLTKKLTFRILPSYNALGSCFPSEIKILDRYPSHHKTNLDVHRDFRRLSPDSIRFDGTIYKIAPWQCGLKRNNGPIEIWF